MLEDIGQRGGRWVLVDLEGKGKRIRMVPMAGWARAAVDDWVVASEILEGRWLRAVNMGAG